VWSRLSPRIGRSRAFEAAVVGFDPIVRIPLDVVKRAGDQFLDHHAERRRSIGHDLDRIAMSSECGLEEPTCGFRVAFRWHVHVDDLAVLIDRAVDVSPEPSDLDVCLIHEPTVSTEWRHGAPHLRGAV
jgi:hypothetical protein